MDVYCFRKTFDTVTRRLLWARLRSLGLKRKLLRALRPGCGDRRLIGKFGANLIEPYRDIGLGVRQGEIDSAEAFEAFIDDLDTEIERSEDNLDGNFEYHLLAVENARRISTCRRHLHYGDN